MRHRQDSRMEYKSAALDSPTPARPAGRRAVRVTAVLGPVGTEYHGDVIEPGALAEAVRGRLPRVAMAHDWLRSAGIVTGDTEVPAGDPRLPAFTADGEPWPVNGGGLVLWVDLMPSTTADSTLAVKAARSAGPNAAWSFGYRVLDGEGGRGRRRIRRLDVFTIAPPLPRNEIKRGDMRPGDMEVKGLPVGASVQHTTGKRYAIQCGVCGQPVALSNRPLRAGAGFVCQGCIDDLGRLVDPFDLPEGTEPDPVGEGADFGEFDDDEPDDAAPHVTAEDAYGQALDDETEYDMGVDGTLGRTSPERRRWRP